MGMKVLLRRLHIKRSDFFRRIDPVIQDKLFELIEKPPICGASAMSPSSYARIAVRSAQPPCTDNATLE